MKTFQKLTAGALLSAVVFSGCYGKFALTRKVYEINGQITNNKFVHSLVAWVFLWLPVYGLAGFADFVVLNTIEFWTGNNPMSGGATPGETIKSGEYEAIRDENEITFIQRKDGAVVQSVTISKPVGDIATAKVYDAQGALVAETEIPVQ